MGNTFGVTAFGVSKRKKGFNAIQLKRSNHVWLAQILENVSPQAKNYILLSMDCQYARQCIKKQRHHFANKGPYSQNYSFFSSHVQMWELDHKEGWAPQSWCFLIVVLEKTLQSPLDCKEIKPAHPKGNQPWTFLRRTDAEAKAPIFLPPDGKSQLIGKYPDAGKDWGQEEKGAWEDTMFGWHHRLNWRESVQTLGESEGRRSLAWCSPWGHKESDRT